MYLHRTDVAVRVRAQGKGTGAEVIHCQLSLQLIDKTHHGCLFDRLKQFDRCSTSFEADEC